MCQSAGMIMAVIHGAALTGCALRQLLRMTTETLEARDEELDLLRSDLEREREDCAANQRRMKASCLNSVLPLTANAVNCRPS